MSLRLAQHHAAALLLTAFITEACSLGCSGTAVGLDDLAPPRAGGTGAGDGPGSTAPCASDSAAPEPASDAGGARVAADAAVADVAVDDGDAGATASAGDGAPPTVAPDAAPLACLVTIAVTDAPNDPSGAQRLYLAGSGTMLGDWNPGAAVALASTSTAGSWSTRLSLVDGQRIDFKFIARSPTSITWEDWGAGSNRSLIVACPSSAADGGVGAVVSPVHVPAVGTSYTGRFNVRPPDAT